MVILLFLLASINKKQVPTTFKNFLSIHLSIYLMLNFRNIQSGFISSSLKPFGGWSLNAS